MQGGSFEDHGETNEDHDLGRDGVTSTETRRNQGYRQPAGNRPTTEEGTEKRHSNSSSRRDRGGEAEKWYSNSWDKSGNPARSEGIGRGGGGAGGGGGAPARRDNRERGGGNEGGREERTANSEWEDEGEAERRENRGGVAGEGLTLGPPPPFPGKAGLQSSESTRPATVSDSSSSDRE